MRNDNIRLMECYFLAKSDLKMRYMKRMLRIWQERGERNDVDSQRLSDQVRVIKRNRLLSELEIEDIKRKVTETLNKEAQVRENTENEPVGSENIELVQHEARTGKLDKEEEVEKQSEEHNIIYKKLEREFKRTETDEQV